MALAIVRLGSPRLEGEGLRIGTVRRPPRGVPKSDFASQDWYDVWFPNLAPCAETMKLGQAAETPAQWAAFCKQYKAEMAGPMKDKAGYDQDFHKPASRMWAVENGPFYADKFTTALLLVCIGGLESDEDCHTFDADRNVIPGLYVAGNIQGNRFATEYPIGLKGVSHSMAMYYGYVPGKNALKDI